MRFQQVFCTVLWMIGCFACAGASAQESIFVPFEKPTEAQEMNQVVSSASDDVEKWIELQSGLYKIVKTFDEQARQLERVMLSNDEARVNNHLIEIQAKSSGIEADEYGKYGGESPIISSSLCQEMDASLDRYISKKTPELDVVVQSLTNKTKSMSDAEKAEFAKRLNMLIAGIPELRRAEEILYLCLYKYKNEAGFPTTWSVDKTLRKWFAVQQPLLDAWIGNVD